jgi:hypothetical protein
MSEFEKDIQAVGKSFAEVGMEAAVASNRERASIARQNIAATVGQLELEETVQRRDIARALAVNQGALAAQAAWKGGGQVDHAEAAAMRLASEKATIATANRVNKELAFIASQEFVKADPLLAAFKSGVEGVQYATSIAQSLMAEGEDIRRISRQHLGTDSPFGLRGGRSIWGTTTRHLRATPGFSFADLLGVE